MVESINFEFVSPPTEKPNHPGWSESNTYPTGAIVSVYMGIKACEFSEAKAIYDFLKPYEGAMTAPSFDEINAYCQPILLKQFSWLKEVEPPMTSWTDDVVQAWLKGIVFKYGSKLALSKDLF